MSKKKFSYKSSRLTAEQKSLLKQEKELRQKEALLTRRLEKLPTMMGKKLYSQERYYLMQSALAPTRQLPEKFAYRKERSTYRGRPMREKRAAKIKFVILVLVLTLLLVLIWRSLPV